MANETFKVNDPFGLLAEQEGEDNPFVSTNTSSMENNPFLAAAKSSEAAQRDQGAFGDQPSDGQPANRFLKNGSFNKPMGEFEATEADWVDQLKIAAGMMFTFDEQDQIDIIKSTLPEASIRIDDGGNAIVSYRGEEGFVNEPGASWRDFASVAGTLLAFTPAFRTAKYASTVAGKSAIVGVANTMTDATMQGTVQLMGGEKEADVERALIAGVIGGGSIAVVDKVAKIVAPLIAARGAKQAKKIIEDVGVHQKKFEQMDYNPQEAFDRALRKMRLSTHEGETLSKQAGTEIKSASLEQVHAFDKRITTRIRKALDSSPAMSGITEFTGKLLVPMHTRMLQMAPEIAAATRKAQHNTHMEMISTTKRVEAFTKNMDDLMKSDPDKFRILKRAINNGDVNSIERLMVETGNKTNYEEVRIVLDEFKDLIKSGGGKAGVADFFPRGVTDYKQLAKVLTGKEYGAITTRLDRARLKVGKKGQELDSDAISKIVNDTLREVGKGYGKMTRSSKARTIQTIDDTLLDQYSNPQDVLKTYLHNMIAKKHKQRLVTAVTKPKKAMDEEIEKIKSSQTDPKMRAAMIKSVRARGTAVVPFEQDTMTSIRDMVQRHALEGKISARDQQPMIELLDSMLNSGQRQMSGFVQDVKNLFYVSTLGNFMATLTQFGDVGMSGVINGITPTAVSFIKTTPKITKGGIRAEEVGIALDRVQEEMVSNTKATAKMLDWVLNKTGFKGIDRWGKRTFINAAHIRLQKDVKSAKGLSDFKDKYKASFTEEELHQTIESMRAGRLDDNVKFVLWNELSDVQPLTLLEMPQIYANNPNGRIFYMLKTFTIKQLDIMRRRAFADINAGRITRGVQRLGAHNAMMLAAGASVETIKDLIKGRDVDLEDKLITGIIRNFGTQEGLGDTLFGTETKKASVMKAMSQIALPPVSIADTAWDDIMHIGRQFNSYKNLPFVGNVAYSWWGGGLEASNERLKQRKAARNETSVQRRRRILSAEARKK